MVSKYEGRHCREMLERNNIRFDHSTAESVCRSWLLVGLTDMDREKNYTAPQVKELREFLTAMMNHPDCFPYDRKMCFFLILLLEGDREEQRAALRYAANLIHILKIYPEY